MSPTADVNNYLITTLGRGDSALRPVTTGKQEKDAKLNKLHKNPIYQFASVDQWGDASANKDELITPIVNDVYYDYETNNQYKWDGTNWVVNADEQVDALPATLASIGDSYHNTDTDKDVIWDGNSWVKGGDGALGDKTTAELDELVVDLDHSYELNSDHKIYVWTGNGNNFALKELLFKVDVTIYLEGWHPFASKGDVDSKSSLGANYLNVNDSYHVDDVDKDYIWNGSAWVLGGDGSNGNVSTFRDLRLPSDSFHAVDDDKIYVYNGSEWVEGSGSAIWDARDYIGAQFNVGIRFTSEAHTDH